MAAIKSRASEKMQIKKRWQQFCNGKIHKKTNSQCNIEKTKIMVPPEIFEQAFKLIASVST